MESVRPATATDLARCAELLGQARGAAAGQRGGRELETIGAGTGMAVSAGSPDEDLVAAWAGGTGQTLVVGLFEGVVVGIGAGEVRAVGQQRWGRVLCCYVEPAARTVGVGSALLASLLEWFGAQGCAGVDATALPGDRATKQLYEAAGLKARLLILHRPLG